MIADTGGGKRHHYSDELCSAVFSLAPLGSGHSPRVLDSIMHGAIPVIIQDGVLQDFEGDSRVIPDLE